MSGDHTIFFVIAEQLTEQDGIPRTVKNILRNTDQSFSVITWDKGTQLLRNLTCNERDLITPRLKSSILQSEDFDILKTISTCHENTKLVFLDFAPQIDRNYGVNTFLKIIEAARMNSISSHALIYDFIPLELPDLYPNLVSNYAKSLIDLLSCSSLIAISEHVKDDYLERLEAIGLGKTSRDEIPEIAILELASTFPDMRKRDVQTNDPFKSILILGSVEARKNHELFLKTLKLLIDEEHDFMEWQVHIVGSLDPKVFMELKLKLSKNVRFYGKISNEEVIAIANVCDFGVYLSKSEGFGLPILDYFSLGLPVLAPNIPPYNQLHDKGVLFADITSADSLKIQLRNIMKNVELRNNLTKEVNEIELIDWASVTQTLMRKIKSSKGELTWSLDSRSIDFVKKENSFLKNQEFKASLTIAISTYNRYESLKLNLSWLMNLVEERDLHLVVIDNASTDETHSLKAQYEERGVKWITNPTNLGLLGNMRRVACEINTTHVWTIGDDDFITPEGLEITLELLNKFPNMPTIVHQIAVFHANLSLTNNQSDLKLVLKSAKSLSNHVESGFSKVIEVATYNETLFGALYQFVWRSDWVRGSFAHYEMGEFFSDNWNTIPSTHYLLEFCPQNLVYWSHVVGIKANGLNSWENHRPKWHSLITPKAIQMARINGMNQRFGDDLQKHHQELFVDSFKSKENREIKMSKAEILEALDMASRLESSNREFLLLLESELKKFSS